MSGEYFTQKTRAKPGPSIGILFFALTSADERPWAASPPRATGRRTGSQIKIILP
jgi:hypothetical protein